MKSAAQDPRRLGLNEKVAFLSQTNSYASAPSRVERVETHMAYVFLTDQHAWKLKKPVKTPFLDFSTIEKRRHDCEEEVRLNRRLAGDIYLGVVPLTRDEEGSLRLDGNGLAVDWLVQMRRLPRERSMESLIHAHSVQPKDIRRVARQLSDFYRRADPIDIAPGEYPASLLETIDANDQQLGSPEFELSADTFKPIIARQRRYVEEHRSQLDQRARQGSIVEAHGDLRPEHVFLVDPPVIVDCLEFNRDLRILDTASELMFLALECERQGAAWVKDLLFETYTEITQDAPPPDLLTFYRAWHACTRAKVSLWHIHDGRDNSHVWIEKARKFLRLADASRGD